jgi:acetyltransferase-like isoleucine patch superfamily enzyme
MFLWLTDKFASILFRLRFDKVVDVFKRHYQYRKVELLKTQFKSVGKGFYLHEGYRIHNPQYIAIGDHFHALSRCRIEAIDLYENETYKPEIIIGNMVSVNDDFHIGCIDRVVIEDGVLIASKVYISDHFHGDATSKYIYMAPNLRPLTSKGPVIIKKNAWIGEGVCILPGIVIGENAIIGANAVVTKSIPDNSVAAGIPAQVIKTL